MQIKLTFTKIPLIKREETRDKLFSKLEINTDTPIKIFSIAKYYLPKDLYV